jgi:hypothetical protein
MAEWRDVHMRWHDKYIDWVASHEGDTQAVLVQHK